MARNLVFIIEQPLSSVIEYHPRFMAFEASHKLHKTFIKLVDYGGGTEKPTR